MAEAAIAVERLEGKAQVPVEKDPMAIRWGINVVERNSYVPGYQFGFTHLKFAQFFPIRAFDVPEEFHSVDDNPNLPREVIKTHPALSVQNHLSERLGGTDHFGNRIDDKPNKGLQVGFIGEDDVAKMAVISKTLLPSLPRIREIAGELGLASPISPVCEGQDALEDERTACTSCWLKWITSPLCSEYIAHIADKGMPVFSSNEPGKQWTVAPTVEEFEKGQQLVLNALQIGTTYQLNEWRTIAGELERGERKGLDKAGLQDGIRKDVHQPKPEDRQVQVAKEYAKAGDNSEVIKALAEATIRSSESQARIEALLAGVLAKDDSKGKK